jgi:hypothetical protein
MSFNCRWYGADAYEVSFPLFLEGFRESALRASRAMVGAPLEAAAGRATTVKRDPCRQLHQMKNAKNEGVCSLKIQPFDLFASIFAFARPSALLQELRVIHTTWI